MAESLVGKIADIISGTGRSYFEEKATDLDFSQINALPPELQAMLLDGTPQQVKAALGTIRRLERQTRTVLLGPAAMELIKDERARRGSD